MKYPNWFLRMKARHQLKQCVLSGRRLKQHMEEMRNIDELDALRTEDGFFLRRRGRDGYIYYGEDGRLCKLYYEMSGAAMYDILLAPLDLREWMRPEGMLIQRSKQLDILHKLRSWLKEQKLRSNIDLPANTEILDRRCAWKDCCKQKMKGSAYCPYHYDLNLLLV